MRRRAGAVASLACLLLVVAPAPGARALSCVAAPTGEQSTRALVLSGNFAGRFDGAVVGLVRGVVGTPRGEPLVDVDVEQSFGPRLHGVVRVVGSYWYPMEKGRRYLIPYVLRSGVRHSLLCWDSPQPVARLLPGAAFTAGPSAAPSPSPLAAPAGSSETTWPWLLAGSLVAAGLASLAGLGAARRRARRATPGTG